MQVVIVPTPGDVAQYSANLIQTQITLKPNSVLGLATGSSPLALYEELVRRHQEEELSFQQCHSFNLDEYLGLGGDHPQSYRYFMNEKLFNRLNIPLENTRVPNGLCQDATEECLDYEKQIQLLGGVDLQVLGIGRNGHIGFNEPSSSLASRTRVKTLTPQTVKDNARFFQAHEQQPHLAITMGIGTIMDSRKILLLATGENKSDAIKAMVEGSVSASCPASALQFHPAVTLVCDLAAAEKLDNKDFYRYIEQEAQQLGNK